MISLIFKLKDTNALRRVNFSINFVFATAVTNKDIHAAENMLKMF